MSRLLDEWLNENKKVSDPVNPDEVEAPSIGYGALVDDSNTDRISGRDLLFLPDDEKTRNPLLDEWLNEFHPESSFDEPLTITDYISDASQELLAGVAEGVTLQHAEFGEIGHDTTIGDIARVVGSIGGSIVPYTAIAATLGHLGIFAGVAATPAVIGRMGLTAFLSRMFSRGDEDEDMFDRIEASLINSGIGMAIGSLPFALDKAVLKFHGGPVKYMERMKGKLASFLVNKLKFSPEETRNAVSQFESSVSKQGGAKALNAAGMRRVIGGQKLLAKQWTGLNRQVHALTGKKGLGLDKETYYANNIKIIGEAHTNRMNVSQLRELAGHYKYELTKFAGTDKYTPQSGMTYQEMQKSYTNFNPGIFSQNLPVERTMRRLGLQKLYDKVYDSKILSLQEQQGYDTVRRGFSKSIKKKEFKSIFRMMDETKVPQKFGERMIYGTYRAAAKKYGVSDKGAEAAAWIRVTSNQLLKRMNGVLVKEGKEQIVPRDAYITHLIEDTAGSMGGMTPELWTAIKFGKGAKGFSRFLQQRFGNGNVKENPFTAHSAYVKSALKMIHLKPSTTYVRNSMDAKTVLEGGVKKGLILPRNVRQYIDDWLDHGVMEVNKNIDRQLNATLRYSAKAAAGKIKMAGYRGTLLGNPLSVIKNITQQDLNIARLGKHWLSGIRSFNPKHDFYQGMNGWKFADKYCKLLQSRMPGLEGLDPTTMGYLTKVGFSPFKAVDKANIVAGFNGAFKKNIAEGKSFGDSINLADRLVRDTQFNYMNIDQPLMWLSAPGKLASQFQSWWTRFLEETWSWGGTMPYGDGTGRTIRIAKHAMNVAKSKEMMRFLGTNLTLLYALNKAGLGYGLSETKIPVPGKNSGVFPTSVPPSLSALLGLAGAMYGITIGDTIITNNGINRLERQLGTHTIPGYNVLRKIKRITEGKAPVKALFLPMSTAEYELWRQ